MQLSRSAAQRPVASQSRARVVRCEAKVVRAEGAPRVVRGKCFVTKDVRIVFDKTRAVGGDARMLLAAVGQESRLRAAAAPPFSPDSLVSPRHPDPALKSKQNIDTDQIIPAEYLTLVPSKVSGEQSIRLDGAQRAARAACSASLLLLLCCSAVLLHWRATRSPTGSTHLSLDINTTTTPTHTSPTSTRSSAATRSSACPTPSTRRGERWRRQAVIAMGRRRRRRQTSER